MKLARYDLVAALSLRYDHYSSQSLFEAACKGANLGDQEHYTAAEVALFRAALSKLGDRLQRVDDRLDSLLGESAQPPAPMPSFEDANPAQARTTPAVTEPATPKAPTPATETAKGAGSATSARAPQATPSTPATHTAKAPASEKPAHAQSPAPMTAPDGAKPAHAQAPAPMTAPDGAKPASAETRIILTGIELADGDALFVCGDRVELGDWDPERARPMMRDGDAWIAVVPRGEGAFKFLRRTEEGDVTWESGENREIGAAVQIETSWQSRSS